MVIGSIPQNTSSTHKQFVTLLEQLKPAHKIFLEYSVKKFLLNYWDNNKILPEDRDLTLLVRSRFLSFDVYDSTVNIVFEINGTQHTIFNPFFHSEIGDLDVQRKNDSTKKRACIVTGARLITIGTDDELTSKTIADFYAFRS